MKAHHFDTETGNEIPAHKVESSVTGFISWQRLASVLRSAGELKTGEVIGSFQVDDRGLMFRVR